MRTILMSKFLVGGFVSESLQNVVESKIAFKCRKASLCSIL